MVDNKDYMARITKARKKRNHNDYTRYLILAGVIIVLIVLVVLIGKSVTKQTSGVGPGQSVEAGDESMASSEAESTKSEEEIAADEKAKSIEDAVSSYQNLGFANVSGYLNIRESASTGGKIIGKLMENSGCEILETEGDWYKISSGGIEGYVSNQFIMTGEEAEEKARDAVKLRAVVTTEKLNIRQEPETDAANVVAQALIHERYEVVEQQEDWVQITEGYLSSDYVEVKYCLNEARKLDLKAMALNQYDNIVISKVSSYLNIRKEPKDDGNGNIIGKLPSKAAGEILETVDGWYKIKSGNITGYVTSDPQFTATGQEAKDIAVENASLMAIINTDKLNVRVEPTTDAKIWTQISKEDRYPVVQQLDGWVEVEMDTENSDKAYIATRDNNVEVRYALAEAIKFSPLEEKANQELSRRTQIVNYALQFVGNPYVWGGTSLTKGADCSGFTMSVLGHFGIKLPHYSGSQAKMGRAIKSSEMRPGDLIFYANSSGTINHVSIYIGNGQIVHAASRKSGIKISTWNYRKPKTIRNMID